MIVDDAKQKFCRNAASVARVLGIRLFKQRKRRSVQLEEVRSWMGQPDFPKRAKFGWPAEEVAQWHDKRTGTNGHGNPDLFTDDAKIKEMRVKAIRMAYAEGKKPDYFRSFQLAELIACKIPKEFIDKIFGSTSDDSDVLYGQEGVSNFFREEFSYSCNNMDVSRWLKGTNLPYGCSEPLPPGFRSGRYKKSVCRPWGSKYLQRKPGSPELPLNGDIRKQSEELAFKKQQKEYDLYCQQTDGLHILKTDHETALRSAGAIVWARFVRCLETALPAGLEAQLKAIPAEQAVGAQVQAVMAEVRRRHQAAVDAIQRELGEQVG